MWIQKINDFRSQNPQATIPEWFWDSDLFNWVYIWEVEGGGITVIMKMWSVKSGLSNYRENKTKYQY